MLRSIVGVVVGCVVGMALIMAGHGLSMLVYRPPPSLDWNDQAAFRDWLRSLPDGAFVLALLSHALGPFGGGWLAALIARRGKMLCALIVGAFFLAGGIMNLFDIPHPTWFAIADPLMYLPAAYVAGLLVPGRKGAGETAAANQSPRAE